MKKAHALLLLILCAGITEAFAESYRISTVEYDITGITRQYAVEQKVLVDKKQVFEGADALLDYISDYKQQLENTRVFDTVSVDFSVGEPDEDGIAPVTLFVQVKDSLHFIATPYPKYDSNSGFSLRLKAKDTNFLGSMEAMSADFNFAVEQDSEDEPAEYTFGLSIDFDTPFKLGAFNAVWTNAHEISYTIGSSTPEWNFQTGLELELPFDRFSLCLDVYQSFIRDLDYEDDDINGVPIHYGDGTYFTEDAKFSVPIVLQEIQNWGKIYYEPYLQAVYNWDFDGISDKNEDLTGPVLTIGQTLSTSRVNWEGNLRTGIDASLTQSFAYNVQENNFIPGISGEFKAYKAFKYFGLCTDIYAFAYLNGKSAIGSRLRGIRDDQYFSDGSGHADQKACETPAAFIVNIDIPIRLFRIYWERVPLVRKVPFAKYLDFEFQISPFFDFALLHNRATRTDFHYRDGFYAGGLEAIIYPLRWKGIQLRASFGIDLGRKLPGLKGKLNQDWRKGVSAYELSIGIGLHY